MGIGRIIRRAVAARAAAGPRIPGELRELAAPRSMPWHVRTLILPLSNPPGMLFLNLITGRVRIAGFDDDPPDCVHHLVVMAVDGDRHRAGVLTFEPDAIRVEAPGELAVEGEGWEFEIRGEWPRYRHTLRVPSWEMDASLETVCSEPLHWWSQTHPLYSHFSAFGQVRGGIGLGGLSRRVESGISLEHGCGGNLRRLPGRPQVPATMFHYQMGALDNGATFALGTFAAAGVEFFHRGVLIAGDGTRFPIEHWQLRDVVMESIEDRCGGSMEVPTAYHLDASSASIELSYDARTICPTLAGRGRLTSGTAALQGRLRVADGPPAVVEGSVYVEHLYRRGGQSLPR